MTNVQALDGASLPRLQEWGATVLGELWRWRRLIQTAWERAEARGRAECPGEGRS